MSDKVSDIEFWKNQIQICQDYMKPRQKNWRELLRRYELDYESATVNKDQIIRKSSMYPIARQVRASVAFNYPRYTVTVDDDDYERAGEILTRAANAAIKLMEVKREVQQQTFDTLFCGVSWGKYWYNPPGANAEPPYVSNDEFREDFVAYSRISPFNVFVDPLTPPHRLGDARFIIERLCVPMEFLEADDRYNKRAVGKLKVVGDGAVESDFLEDMEEASRADDGESAKHVSRSMTDGKMVELWEISDRTHGQRITLNMGIDTLLEKGPHPFLKAQPTYEEDAFGNRYPTGYEATGGYLTKGGFSYSALKIDTAGEGFWPIPSMEYIKDLEQMQIDSLTRRADLTKRYPRVVLVNQNELSSNPNLADQLKNARDGDAIPVSDVNAFQEVPWGNPPQDQLNLQNEARQSEEEVLRVSEMSGVGRRTATEASFAASAGAINREWFKEKVADLYVEIGTNVLRIFGDARYTPQEFVVRVVADEGGPKEALQILQQAHFLTNFYVTVDAESIQPMAAQRERDNLIAMSDRLLPHTDLVNRQKVLELLVSRGFGIANPDSLFTQHGGDATQALLALENQQLSQGIDPGVLPGLDHMSHIKSHEVSMQEALSQLQLPPGTDPIQQQQAIQQLQQQQQQIQQAYQTHIGAHQEHLGQAAAALTGGGSPAAAGEANPNGNDITSQVRANAQNVANEAISTAQENVS